MPSRLLLRIRRPLKTARSIPQRGLVDASSNHKLAEPSLSTTPSCRAITPTKLFHSTTPIDMKPKRTGLPGKGDKAAPAPFYLSANPPPYCQTCGRIMKADSSGKEGESERKYCSSSCRRNKPKGLEVSLEKAFVGCLNATKDSKDRRLVSCDEVLESFFGHDKDAIPTASGEHPGQTRARQREKVRQAARRGVVFGFSKDGGSARWPKCEAVQEGRVVEPSFAKGDFSVRWRD